MIKMTAALLTLALLSFAQSVGAQDALPTTNPTTQGVSPETNWTPAIDRVAGNMRVVAQGLYLYADKHDGRFPERLGDLLAIVSDPTYFLTPGDLSKLGRLPDKPDGQWIDDHTSFVYIAGGISLEHFRAGVSPGVTAALHTRLDAPFNHPAIGDAIIIIYVDGHCGVVTVGYAKQIIADSIKTIAQARTYPPPTK